MKLRISVLAVAVMVLASPVESAHAEYQTQWLPIQSATPGALNPAVTKSNISKTICVSGYTKKIRPSSAYTTKLKKTQLASTYARYGSSQTSLVEEDHLIPLELGGSPRDSRNLWPELWNGTWGAHKKDVLENKLHLLVCSQQISLQEAQSAIATNWVDAYSRYILGVIPSPTETPSPIPTDSPIATPMTSQTPTSTASASATPTPSGSKPVGATGKCKDGTYSFSTKHSGMCSGHGGVETFYA